jgi:hypothetical protein
MRAWGVLAFIAVILCGTLARSQPLELQAVCAAQSQKAFQEWENESKNGPAASVSKPFSSDYQSHYNTKLKKCLVLIEAVEDVNGQIAHSANLFDAFERRQYASFLWMTRENRKYWEVPPIVCALLASFRQQKNCTTREEFDSFVAEYMEE